MCACVPLDCCLPATRILRIRMRARQMLPRSRAISMHMNMRVRVCVCLLLHITQHTHTTHFTPHTINTHTTHLTLPHRKPHHTHRTIRSAWSDCAKELFPGTVRILQSIHDAHPPPANSDWMKHKNRKNQRKNKKTKSKKEHAIKSRSHSLGSMIQDSWLSLVHPGTSNY